MAEILFANLSKTGMELSTITGAAGSLYNLEIRGTHSFNDNITDVRDIKVNYESILSGTSHGQSRGMTMIIFNTDMSISYSATFDLYGAESAQNALADKMKTITSSQIAVLCSRDAIATNTKLDDSFKYYRSNAWAGVEWFNKSGISTEELADRRRTSYAAVICGRKKAIVAEKFVGHGAKDGYADIQLAFSDPTKIGYSGFGKPLIDDIDQEILKSAGTTEMIKRWIDAPLTDLNLKVGDEYMFSSLAEINAISASTSTFVLYVISYYAGSTWKAEQSRIVRCVEGWQQVEIRHKIPVGCDRLVVDVRQRRDPHPSTPTGTTWVKNTVMSLSDNTQAQTSGVSIGTYGTSVRRYEDSLGNFGSYDPDGYYESFNSESNLLRNLPLTQQTDEPIRWMNRILDNNNERIVMNTTGDQQNESSVVLIDPTQMYYCSVWVNRQVKTDGEYMLGFRSFNDDDTQLKLRPTNDILNAGTEWMYSQTPAFDMLEDRQWYLMQGFLLPHDITQEDANAFVEANQEFYGWDDLYGNGIGISDEGNGYYGWVNNANCTKGKLAFLDFYNDTATSNSLWALPIIREVKLGSIDIDDGLITSISLS
jgi:hypothetical protein